MQWSVKHPYQTLEWDGSENVPGVDGPQNPAETGTLPDGKTASSVVEAVPDTATVE